MANYFRNYCLLISHKKQHEFVLLFDVRFHESKSNADTDFVRTTSKDRYSIKKKVIVYTFFISSVLPGFDAKSEIRSKSYDRKID